MSSNYVNKITSGDLSGVRHPGAKLDWRTVEKIRKEYKEGDVSYLDLAKKYKVSQGNIGRIIRKEIWTR